MTLLGYSNFPLSSTPSPKCRQIFVDKERSMGGEIDTIQIFYVKPINIISYFI